LPLLLLALLAGLTCRTAAEPAAIEGAYTPQGNELRAAFVYQFLKYVEWPDSVKPAPGEPLVIGVLGEQPIRDALSRFSAQSVAGHPLRIRHFEPGEDVEYCHLLFVGQSKRYVAKNVLEAIEGPGTLTVGDARDFLEAGGMIELRVVDNRIRFDVNLAPSKAAGLNISSRLLRLALRVEGAEVGGED